MVLDEKMLEKVDESAILARQLIMGDEIDNAKIFEKMMGYGVGIYLVESEDYDAFSKIENNKPVIYLNKALDENRRIYVAACELGMIFLGAASKWLLIRDYPSDSKSLVHICYKNKDQKIQQDDDRVAERFANVFLFKAAELAKKEIEEKLKSSVDEFYNHSIQIGGPIATGMIVLYNNSTSPVETASELEITEKIAESKVDYHEIILKEQARRQTLVNDWINGLSTPLLNEVMAKDKCRSKVLKVFGFCSILLIIWVVYEVIYLQKGGINNNEMSTIKYLFTILLTDIFGGIMIVFKYFFDKNNTSFKGLNDLSAKAIQYEKENDGK